MSRAALDRLLFVLTKDKVLQAEFAADPMATLARFDLDEQERDALVNRDFATLYVWGVHPLLIRNFSGTVGVRYLESYRSRGLKT